MRLMKQILLLTMTVICVTYNAMADCVSGKTKLSDGRQFIEPVTLNTCEKVNALISDKKATKFKMSCSKTKFKCVAHECSNNMNPDKNGICSTVNPSEQTRYHKNLLSYTYQKRNFFDACLNFAQGTKNDRTVQETQSVIKEVGKKIKYACITDFAGYKLSTALAIGLIERHNWSNNIGKIRADNCTIQQNNRFKSGEGRSIRCISDNGVYTEFIFGKMDSLSTSREAVAGTLCPAFGFQHLESNGNQHRCHTKNKLNKDMQTFLRQNELMDIKNVDNGYFEIVPLRSDIEKKDDLSKILNTDEFKNVITDATAHIKILLRKYIEQRLKASGYEIESIKFYSARSDAFYTVDGSTWPVEIFACKKNNCKNYIKLFKFRSLFGSPGADLHFASWTILSVEEMSCLIKDGLFDSKHCFFLEEEVANEKKQCTNLNTFIQSVFAKPSDSAKTEWDAENNMCVLNSSNKNAKTLKNLEIAAQVGLLAITTVATAGAGSALAIGLAAGGLLADGIALQADIAMSKASVKFLKLSTRCYDATCAKKYFEEEFKHMLQLIDRISEDEFNVVDSEMDRLVKLLDDKYIGDMYAKGLENLKKDTTGILKNMSTEEVIETVATIVSVALSIANATKGVKALISKSKTRAPKFLKRLDVRINQCTTCKKTKVDDLLKERQIADASKTSKAVSKADDVVTNSNKTVVALDNAVNNVDNIGDFLSHSNTLQDLNTEGRLELRASSSLGGKQYMRIKMGGNPDAQETQVLIQKLQSEGFYVSSGTTNGGEKFIAVSRENIFAPWNNESGNWLAHGTDDIVNIGRKGTTPAISNVKNGMQISAAEAEASNIKMLRKEASGHFDEYLKEVQTNNTGMGRKLPKERLTDAGWDDLNKSLAGDNVQLVDTGDGYMQFVRANHVDNASVSKSINKTNNSTVVNTGKSTPTTSIEQSVFTQIDDAYTQQASQDVLEYQRSQNMGQKAAAYNDAFKRAKTTLSPKDYEAFETIAGFEEAVKKQERTLEVATQNLRQNGFNQQSIDMYLGDRQKILQEQRTQLRQLRQQHPKAAKFMDDNYANIMDAKAVDIDSDYIYNIQKKINVTNELSKYIDDKKLFENVRQFKDDLVAGFTPDMYRKAKNWNNLSGPDKANFMVNDLIPYIQKNQGLSNAKIDVHLMPASHIGGNAAFCDDTQCFQVSFEALNNMPFERLMSTLSHEAIHAGQYLEGGRSLLSKDLIKVANDNYVAAVMHSIQANRANAVEREAYMATDGMFSNFLDEVARYHNW